MGVDGLFEFSHEVCVNISNWEQNTRISSGMIIADPDTNNDADKFMFAIPSNVEDYEGIIMVTQPREGVLRTR